MARPCSLLLSTDKGLEVQPDVSLWTPWVKTVRTVPARCTEAHSGRRAHCPEAVSSFHCGREVAACTPCRALGPAGAAPALPAERRKGGAYPGVRRDAVCPAALGNGGNAVNAVVPTLCEHKHCHVRLAALRSLYGLLQHLGVNALHLHDAVPRALCSGGGNSLAKLRSERLDGRLGRALLPLPQALPELAQPLPALQLHGGWRDCGVETSAQLCDLRLADGLPGLQLGHRLREALALTPRVLGGVAGGCHDAPHALGYGLLFQQREGACLGRVHDVGATAELDGLRPPLLIPWRRQHLVDGGGPDRHYAHGIWVRVAGDRPRACEAERGLQRHLRRGHGRRRLDHSLDQLLHALKLSGANAVRAEVKAQGLCGNQGPPLVRAVAQDLPQRPVQHVGHGVVGRDAGAVGVVHSASHAVAHAQRRRALWPQPLVQRKAAEEPHPAHGQERRAVPVEGHELAHVADLATSLCIEGRQVQDDAHGLVAAQLLRALYEAVLGVDGQHRGLRLDVHLVLLAILGRLHTL
mmetsp:Transcript_95973/g.304715  ORF Transcript_95973/g.304715 Transcript_95973/m.304715 type:complete len:524 (-) Transcript_95973:404-1975(-)